ncbi:hypothetical protein EASAB2608_01116 [Streptomyces sp. EAS-AB2608]|nr:hypothetical protein EASAB2608_01116 [Streptomyces sp. EAS-AB2608]
MASKTQARNTDERQWDARQSEYTTYAPSGQTCPNCQRPIKGLELCRRITVERASASPAVVYRHHPQCPKPQAAR